MIITFKENEIESSVDLGEGSSAEDVIRSCMSMMWTQTYTLYTIKNALEDVLEDINYQINKC